MRDQERFLDGVGMVEVVPCPLLLIEVGEIPVVAVLVDGDDPVGPDPSNDLLGNGGLS